MKKTTLVVMAAGIGSRFGGGIKQLEPVGPIGEIIMDYSIHDAMEAGFKKVGSDANGHVVLGDNVTKEDITKLGIPGQDTTYEKATAEKDGLMSKEDKKKLDDMAVAEDAEVQSMLDEVFGTTEEEP